LFLLESGGSDIRLRITQRKVLLSRKFVKRKEGKALVPHPKTSKQEERDGVGEHHREGRKIGPLRARGIDFEKNLGRGKRWYKNFDT